MEVSIYFDTPKDLMGRSLGVLDIQAVTTVEIANEPKRFGVSQRILIHIEDYPHRNAILFTIERLLQALAHGIREAGRIAKEPELERACLKANARYRALRAFGAKFLGEWYRTRAPYSNRLGSAWRIDFECESAHCSGGLGARGRVATIPQHIEQIEEAATRYCLCGHMRALVERDSPEVQTLTAMELLAG